MIRKFRQPVLIFVIVGFMAVFGGSAQFGQIYDIPLRLIALLVLGISLRPINAMAKAEAITLLWIAAAAIALLIAQVIPLPPAIWTRLPGRAVYEQLYVAAGLQIPWLPLSLSPERTVDALYFMLAPLSGLCAGLVSNRQSKLVILACLVLTGLLSLAVGMLQLGQGPESSLYLYAITNFGSPVGFFANRNHQGIFLAVCMPIVLALIEYSRAQERAKLFDAIGLSLILILLMATLLTQSRAAIVLALGGLGVSLFITWLRGARNGGYWYRSILVGSAVMIAVGLFFSQTIARFALLEHGFNRSEVYPILAKMIQSNWLTGVGFGAFEPAAPRFEPLSSLNLQYWNHAHNDWAQLIAEGGVFALGVLALFLVWLSKRTASLVWQGRAALLETTPGTIAAITVVVMLLAHSLVDYPLRTGFISAIFGFFVGWLASPDVDRATDDRGCR